jgi:phosphohistidine phosphatase
MSMRLILMRHAKSDWDHRVLGDFERPLNRRGRKAARAVGAWMAAKGHVPDAVYCSSATRTSETCALVLQALGTSPDVTYSRDLYLASADMLLRTVGQAKPAATVMLLAHNPGCAILAAALAERAPPHARFDDFPTAATAILEFEIDSWAALSPKQGQVVDFIVPRDLNKPPAP